jgi:HSP20 family protein
MADTSVEVRKPSGTPAPAQDPFRSLRSEMDRMFDRFADGFFPPALRNMIGSRTAQPSFAVSMPAVDVTEDDTSYRIAAELPGLDEKDVEVTVNNGMLVIKGEKRLDNEQKGKNFHISERAYGAFQRSFFLPDNVNPDQIRASFSKGVLQIELPKVAQAQPKKIDVKSS